MRTGIGDQLLAADAVIDVGVDTAVEVAKSRQGLGRDLGPRVD